MLGNENVVIAVMGKVKVRRSEIEGYVENVCLACSIGGK